MRKKGVFAVKKTKKKRKTFLTSEGKGKRRRKRRKKEEAELSRFSNQFGFEKKSFFASSFSPSEMLEVEKSTNSWLFIEEKRGRRQASCH